MKIAVIGAGAVGGYFGAMLAKSANDVYFVARGEHLRAIREKGLRIKSYKGDFGLEVKAGDSPAEFGAADLVLVCVKSYDTSSAIELMRPLVSESAGIISLQNGVENEDLLSMAFGPEKVLGGVAYIGSKVAEPGAIQHSAGGKISIGELDGRQTRRLNQLQEVFTRAGIPCDVSADIRKELWAKLLWNAAFCAIAAFTRETCKNIIDFPPTRKLAVEIMEEVCAVARSKGIEIGEKEIGAALDLSERLGQFKPSLLQDLEAGKRLEYDAFNGAVLRMAAQASVQVPLNSAFNACLELIDSKRRIK